jgi:hypothetical protein
MTGERNQHERGGGTQGRDNDYRQSGQGSDRSNWERGREGGQSGYGSQDSYGGGSDYNRGGYGEGRYGTPNQQGGWRQDSNYSGNSSSQWRQDQGRDHDPHYSQWRQRQMEQFDNDYNEYRQSQQSEFDTKFDDWRKQRGNVGGNESSGSQPVGKSGSSKG